MSDLFHRLRDLPEPPLPPAPKVLETARRAARRSGWTRILAAAGAVLVISGAGVAARVLAESSRDGQVIAGAPASASPAIPEVPRLQAVQEHGAELSQWLMDALPAGYVAQSMSKAGTVTDTPQVFWQQVGVSQGGYRAVIMLRVSRSGGAGMLGLAYGTDFPEPISDPCSSRLDSGIEGATIQGCTVVNIGGVPVRIVTGIDPGLGAVMSAMRYLHGGYVLVSFSQGMRLYVVAQVTVVGHPPVPWQVAVNPRHERPLPAMPFTPRELAAVAADGSLLL